VYWIYGFFGIFGESLLAGVTGISTQVLALPRQALALSAFIGDFSDIFCFFPEPAWDHNPPTYASHLYGITVQVWGDQPFMNTFILHRNITWSQIMRHVPKRGLDKKWVVYEGWLLMDITPIDTWSPLRIRRSMTTPPEAWSAHLSGYWRSECLISWV
jgi:hypothetical protein